MVIWLKTQDDEAVQLTDIWKRCFYVAGDYGDLIKLANQLCIEGMSYEEKFVKPNDNEPSSVLRIPVRSSREAEKIAEHVLIRGRYALYELYNVDVESSQLYMYEKGIYPFAHVNATVNPHGISWELCDSLDLVDYSIPPLREISLSVNIRKKGILPTKADPVESIKIGSKEDRYYSGVDNEPQNLLWLVEALNNIDPDIIYTTNGDSFLFPYLAHRAALNGITREFILGRDSSHLKVAAERGQTYTSYGRICYRFTRTRIFGRLHVDCESSIVYRDCGLLGLIEIARLCRIPVQRVSSTTIGTIVTN